MAVKDTAPYQKQNHPHQTWHANPSIGQVSGPRTDPDSCAALPAAAAPAEVTGSGSRGRTLNAACIQTASPSAAAQRLLSPFSPPSRPTLSLPPLAQPPPGCSGSSLFTGGCPSHLLSPPPPQKRGGEQGRREAADLPCVRVSVREGECAMGTAVRTPAVSYTHLTLPTKRIV